MALKGNRNAAGHRKSDYTCWRISEAMREYWAQNPQRRVSQSRAACTWWRNKQAKETPDITTTEGREELRRLYHTTYSGRGTFGSGIYDRLFAAITGLDVAEEMAGRAIRSYQQGTLCDVCGRWLSRKPDCDNVEVGHAEDCPVAKWTDWKGK